MPGNRHSSLKEALFVDIRVSTDLLQPGLFAPNEENKAYDWLLIIMKKIGWKARTLSSRNCCFLSIGDGRASGIE